MDALSHEPLISVIITAYNSEQYLAEAIKSALAQTYQHRELILIDDGSTDRTAEVANGFAESVQYFRQSNAGAGAARNAGILRASGTFLAFLDSDDLWLPEKLSRQLECFAGNPALDAVFTMIKQFVSSELSEEQRSRLRYQDEDMSGYAPSTMMIRKDSLLRVGLFDTQWKVGEFISWFLRAREMDLKAQILPETYVLRRLHSQNLGIQSKKDVGDHLKVLKAALDRRRRSKWESNAG